MKSKFLIKDANFQEQSCFFHLNFIWIEETGSAFGRSSKSRGKMDNVKETQETEFMKFGAIS